MARVDPIRNEGPDVINELWDRHFRHDLMIQRHDAKWIVANLLIL